MKSHWHLRFTQHTQQQSNSVQTQGLKWKFYKSNKRKWRESWMFVEKKRKNKLNRFSEKRVRLGHKISKRKKEYSLDYWLLAISNINLFIFCLNIWPVEQQAKDSMSLQPPRIKLFGWQIVRVERKKMWIVCNKCEVKRKAHNSSNNLLRRKKNYYNKRDDRRM